MSNRTSLPLFFTAALLLIFTMPIPGYAAWSNDPSVNTPVSIATGNQNDQRIITDDNGGVIIVWVDYRNGNADIYAQKLDANGNPQWSTDGVAVCTATDAQENPRLQKDDNGGAIIVWQDYRNGSSYKIFAQRLDSSGTPLWAANGVAISASAKSQKVPMIQRDGSGGAIITWHDNRNAPTGETALDIYAQRINSSGTLLWTTTGKAVCTAAGNQQNPELDVDGSGGAYIVWQDYRSGSNWDIYAQRLDSSGTPLWTVNGVPVCTASGDQNWQRIAVDDSGRAIISWQDYRSGNANIYVQRLNATNGSQEWTADGVAICTADNDQLHPNLRPLAGGALIAWEDNRSGAGSDIYAQLIDSTGSVKWAANGVAISTAANNQINPSVRDGSHGRAVIAWEDFRAGGAYADVYIQRIDTSGNVLWAANGVAATTSGAADNAYWPMLRINGSDQGAIITWSDFRSGTTDANIYAQKIQSNGTLPCADYPVRIQETTSHYPTIQAAYNAANGQTVQMESIEFTEDLSLNSGHIVKLQGGYYGCEYSSISGFTTVHGKVTIGSGTVTAERLIIM